MLWVVRNRRSDIILRAYNERRAKLWVVRNRRSDIITEFLFYSPIELWVVRNRRSDIMGDDDEETATSYGLFGIVDLI